MADETTQSDALVPEYDRPDRIVRQNVVFSVGAGFIPIPAASFGAVTAIQINMIRQISAFYGVDFSESAVRPILSAVVGASLARIGAEALKVIPGIGTAIGGASMAIMSGASTYALGEAFTRHFEAGGDLHNIDVERFRGYYRQMVKEGRKVAREFYENRRARDEYGLKLMDKLRELGEMFEKGLITKEEFEEMKEKIVRQFRDDGKGKR